MLYWIPALKVIRPLFMKTLEWDEYLEISDIDKQVDR